MGEVLRRKKGGKLIGYSLRFYEGGRRRVLASKQPTYAEARRMLIEIEARIARGEVGLCTPAPRRHTVAELLERFASEYSRPRVKDVTRYRQQARSVLRRVLPHLGARLADSLKPEDIGRLRNLLVEKWAPGSVKLTLDILSSAFSWALREGLVPSNPCRGVERPIAPQSLDFLSRQEARTLLEAAAAGAASSPLMRMLHVGIAMALHIGLRKGELLGLRWPDLDLETRRLTIARSYRGTPKSNQARHLRLPTVLVPLLQSWREHCPSSPQGAVFPLGRGADRVAARGAMLGLPRLVAACGLRKLAHPWHVLRHSFASHFVMSSGNILALQKILGHKELKQTLIYAHLAPDFLDAELERVRF